MATAKTYSSNTYDCLNDLPVCIQGACCGVLCIPFAIAPRLNAKETHGCCPLIKAFIATEFWLCGLCCCKESIMPCFLSELLKKSMTHHGITEYPGPCGDRECCGCLCQMLLPCTVSCTLCQIWRELNNPHAPVAQNRK
mmetsp:Transcript_34883/g.71955  ORF Transcript_34883/g.71955 Transcript_34883/m.71955 type:complete len:139 (-) Transcript_34883:249-665(-)